jgi:hypothetical protein
LVIWDPTLAVEALSLLSRAYDTVAKGKQGAVQIQLFEKKDEVIKKISYIDPKAAFRQ